MEPQHGHVRVERQPGVKDALAGVGGPGPHWISDQVRSLLFFYYFLVFSRFFFFFLLRFAQNSRTRRGTLTVLVGEG